VEVDEAARQYAEATKRFDELTREAKVIGDRLSALAQGLSSYPERVVIGIPGQAVDSPEPDRVISGEPLPSMEHLVALTTAIRDTARRIDALRERLTLMGRADLVQAHARFFE
jgi:uncharacterized protein with GYD domain